MKRWYSRDWTEYETVKENDAQTEDVKIALEEAVHRQLMSDVRTECFFREGWIVLSSPPLPKNMRQSV